MIESMEEQVLNKMKSVFDETIERVEVVLCNIQHLQSHLLQQHNQNENEEDPYLKFKTDPRALSWIGAAVIPKLESSKDMFITRDKFMVEFQNYRTQFSEIKLAHIKAF